MSDFMDTVWTEKGIKIGWWKYVPLLTQKNAGGGPQIALFLVCSFCN